MLEIAFTATIFFIMQENINNKGPPNIFRPPPPPPPQDKTLGFSEVIKFVSVGRRGSSPGITGLRYIDGRQESESRGERGSVPNGSNTEGEGTGTHRNRQRRTKTQ